MQATGERRICHGPWTQSVPTSVSQGVHRTTERDLDATIKHIFHGSVPRLEGRRGFVVLECRLVIINFIEGEKRRVGFVLNDIEAAATGLVQDGAGAVFNRGLHKIVNMSLLNFESNHEDVHHNPFQIRCAATRR